jgi:hypothetical protein
MDPDVMLTIAFVGYAVIVTVGIGVLLRIADRQRDPGMDDDAAHRARARFQSAAEARSIREPR